MRLEMPLRDEMLVAALAPERTLACVRSHVRLEVASLRKLFETSDKGTKKQLRLSLRSLDCRNLNLIRRVRRGPTRLGGLG